MRFTAQRLAIATALLLNIAVLIALLALDHRMYPLPRGDSSSFWSEAVRVDLRGRGDWGTIARIDGDRAYYMPSSMDAVWVHWLPTDEVMRDYPAVLSILRKRAADPNNVDDEAIGFRQWSSFPAAPPDINLLIACVQDATLRRMTGDPTLRPGIASWFGGGQHELSQQIQRSHHYPANFAFEFVFLTFFIWFLLWPAVRPGAICRAYLHLAAAPFLFLLPTWFGYCACCIPGPGPAGGILYPYGIWFLNKSWTGENSGSERTFLRALPPLLEPIDQTSWDLSDVLTWSSDQLRTIYIAGPYQAAAYSLWLCGALLSLRAAIHIYRRRALRRPGFEVQPALTPSNTTAESAPRAQFPHFPTRSTPPE